jgi:pimeloyl-ACP methyl ester carboxylesterase
LSPSSPSSPPGTVTVDQIYVRYQTPVGPAGPPLVLIHGCCLTGKTWETTPDGRMGWDEYFVRRGHPTYVIDQAWRGRSASDPSAINAAHLGKIPNDQIPSVSFVGREIAWGIFRFGPAYGQTYPNLQFPTEALDEFWKQMVPDEAGYLPSPNPTVPALSLLARKLGGAVLISHSQSGIYPFQTAVFSPADVAGIIAIEPADCPKATGDLTPYKAMPVLVVFGDYIDLSPGWVPRLAGCRAFVAALNAVGGRAKLTMLPEIGVHGNSHMMMQDKNNLRIADLLLDWIAANVKARGS